MRKKTDNTIIKIIIIFLMIFMIPAIKVHATPPSAEPGFSVLIRGSQCIDGIFLEGRFDILVKREEVKGSLYQTPSSLFLSLYGETTPDYIESNDSLWISYLAYVEGANVDGIGTCYLLFASEEDEYLDYSEIKFVYFNDLGETIFLSDSLEMVHPKKNQARYGEIVFNADEPYLIEDNYRINNGFLFIAILLLALSFIPYVVIPILIIGLILVFVILILVIYRYLAKKRKDKTEK